MGDAISNGDGDRWTSRRRLLAALGCGVADRVPVSCYELVGYNSRAWENHEPSYAKLMDRVRADTDCIAMWNPTGNERFLCSAAPVEIDHRVEREDGKTRTTTILHTPRGDLQQVTEKHDGVHTVWVIEHWCKSLDDVDKALSVPYQPVDYDASDFGRIRKEVADHGIIMPSLGDPAFIAANLMAFEQFFLWAFEETEHYARTVEVINERVMENLRRQLGAVTADLYRIYGPEYMTPPYLPPKLFRRFVVPYLTRMAEIIHEHDSKVRIHCHGKIATVLDMFFEAGCDGIDPCEPPPDGDLELDEVKRRCAAAGVSVFGNLELKLLEGGTPQQVRAEVSRMMDQAKAGGGFVLMPTAAPINVPLADRTYDNCMAMIDAALELGRY